MDTLGWVRRPGGDMLLPALGQEDPLLVLGQDDLLPALGQDGLHLAPGGDILLLAAGGDILLATGDITITTEGTLISFSQVQ